MFSFYTVGGYVYTSKPKENKPSFIYKMDLRKLRYTQLHAYEDSHGYGENVFQHCCIFEASDRSQARLGLLLHSEYLHSITLSEHHTTESDFPLQRFDC